MAHDDWRTCLDDLLGVEDGLTDWEMEFVLNLDSWRQGRDWWEPTERQKAKILELYDRHC